MLRQCSQTLLFALSISLLGLTTVALLSTYPATAQTVPWRKQILSMIFGSLCVLGVIAVFFPTTCSEMASGRQPVDNIVGSLSSERYTFVLGARVVHGHHPSLDGFLGHEFKIGSKTFCAGCFGLLIGALASLAGVFAYSTLEAESHALAPFLVGSGIVVVAAALLVPLLYGCNVILRIMINAAFVLGMLSILIGIDTLTLNLEIDLYVIGLSIFWMINRILVSRFNHEKIYSKI